MKKLLFIDACISTHDSRTKKLCDAYINKFMEKNPDYELETVTLRAGFCEPWTRERLIERDGYIAEKDWNHSMFDLPKQYKAADHIVIGTPYWDLSFASILKVYIENIMVGDLTFGITTDGYQGLCNGKMMTYITTAGGFIGNKNLGYEYMQAIADMTGIDNTEFFSAEGLDIVGFDVEGAVKKAITEIESSVVEE